MKNQNRFLPAAACAFGLCVSLTSGLYSRSLHARTLEPAPDLDSWISEVKNASFPPLSVPRRLLLLESEVSDKSEVNFIVDGRAIEKISPFLVVDGPSADLSLRLNQEYATLDTAFKLHLVNKLCRLIVSILTNMSYAKLKTIYLMR